MGVKPEIFFDDVPREELLKVWQRTLPPTKWCGFYNEGIAFGEKLGTVFRWGCSRITCEECHDKEVFNRKKDFDMRTIGLAKLGIENFQVVYICRAETRSIDYNNKKEYDAARERFQYALEKSGVKGAECVPHMKGCNNMDGAHFSGKALVVQNWALIDMEFQRKPWTPNPIRANKNAAIVVDNDEENFYSNITEITGHRSRTTTGVLRKVMKVIKEKFKTMGKNEHKQMVHGDIVKVKKAEIIERLRPAMRTVYEYVRRVTRVKWIPWKFVSGLPPFLDY